jgi:DegV family protein with EDD domain
MTVRVVTDSTSDLPKELAQELGVTVVPLTVYFGEEAFKDGVEMSSSDFFERLTSGNVIPRTTQPTVGDFELAYRSLAEQGHEILSVHISDKLSGTMNSARAGALEVPDAKIEIVDTRTASLAQALVVKVAAEAANGGASLDEAAAAARDASQRTDLYFLLDTLEYLQKGGRIGKAAALIGGLLAIKPVLTVMDGEVHPKEKVRTRAKALARLREIATEGGPYAEIAFIHEAQGDDERAFAEHLRTSMDAPMLSGPIGPVIGTYTGPGVIGFAGLRKA